MKKILFLICLITSPVFAGDINIMRIEPNGVLYDVTTWGQKDFGAETRYQLKLGDPALDKVISLVADQTGSKEFIRCLVYFNADGSLDKIDVQTISGKTFAPDVKPADKVDGKSKTDISDIKSDLQGK